MSIESGQCILVPPNVIQSGEYGIQTFRKTYYSARGTCAVMTYQIEGTDRQLAIMWQIPFDYNVSCHSSSNNIKLYNNEFNIWVMDNNVKCNKFLFENMRARAKKTILDWVDPRKQYQIKAKMSEGSKVSLMIDLIELEKEEREDRELQKTMVCNSSQLIVE